MELVKFQQVSAEFFIGSHRFDDRVCGGGCRTWLFCVSVCIFLCRAICVICVMVVRSFVLCWLLVVGLCATVLVVGC